MSARATVYVVDDDASVRKAVQRLLRSVGLTVETFASAQEFLDRDPIEGAGCLILDVRMPGLNGLELQEKLAASGREIPIIFISGYGDIPTSVRAMKAGAADFLVKPFDDSVLFERIRQCLEQDQSALAKKARTRMLRGRAETLTPREHEVFRLVVTGKRNKDIASDLGASEKTIKVHRGRVMRKMDASSVAELVRMADTLGS